MRGGTNVDLNRVANMVRSMTTSDGIALAGVVVAILTFAASQWAAVRDERSRFLDMRKRFHASVHYKIEELAQASLLAVNELIDVQAGREADVAPEVRQRLEQLLKNRADAFLSAMVEDAATVDEYFQGRDPEAVVSWHRMTGLMEVKSRGDLGAKSALELFCFSYIALKIFDLPRNADAAQFLQVGLQLSPNVRVMMQTLTPDEPSVQALQESSA